MQPNGALNSSPSWVTVLSSVSNSMKMIKGANKYRDIIHLKSVRKSAPLTYIYGTKREKHDCRHAITKTLYIKYCSLSCSACEWHRRCNNLYEYCMCSRPTWDWCLTIYETTDTRTRWWHTTGPGLIYGTDNSNLADDLLCSRWTNQTEKGWAVVPNNPDTFSKL